VTFVNSLDPLSTHKQETREEMLTRWENQGCLVRDCPSCQEFYRSPGMPSNVFAPRHTMSDHCKSGQRPHCTCDTCF